MFKDDLVRIKHMLDASYDAISFFDVNYDTVWDTVKNEIPKLIAELEKIPKD